MSLKVLIVGLGNRSKMWTEAAIGVAETEVVGAADPSIEAQKIFATRFPGIPLFADMSSALDKLAVDAVILVTPPDGHLEQCREIFRRGLPVLAEKPLTLDLAEAVEIVKLGEQAGLPLSISLNFRFLPVYQKYRQLIEERVVGEPGFAQFIYNRNRDGWRPELNKYPLTMQDPMMLEQTIHHLDLMRFCYGREVETITCRTWNPSWSMYQHDSNVNALIGFEKGLEVNYLGTWQSGSDEMEFEWRTDCKEGIVTQKQLFADLFFARTKDRALTPVAIESKREFIDDSRALLSAFIACVKNGGPVPCSGRDHLITLALCFAALESAATAKTVQFKNYLRAHDITT